jgi:type I restriction enzyme S subunit
MTEAPTSLMVPTYPRSVQPGIPRLSAAPEGWSTRRFGDLLKVVQRPVRMTDDGEYDLVTVKRSRGGIASRGRFRGKDISVKSQFALEGADFLISKRQIVHGACAVVPEEFAGSIVSNEYSVLRCKPGLDLGFLRYLSHSVYFQQTCFHSSIGVHVEKMIFKLDDWLKFRVNVPPLEEQKRIAAGFEAVDAKLTALREKADWLRQFKAGLMQRLFSQELRFAREDGSDYPEWEEKPFSEIATRAGEQFDPRKENGKPRVIELEHLESGSGKILSSADIDGQISLKNRFSSGDVLFGKLRPYLRKFARPEFDGVCSSEIWVLRGRKGVSNSFLYALVQSPMFGQMVNISSGSKMPRADWKTITVVDFPVPCTEEQEKMASALSALDAKIDAVTDQIAHMETFKKGLLQKMFV